MTNETSPTPQEKARAGANRTGKPWAVGEWPNGDSHHADHQWAYSCDIGKPCQRIDPEPATDAWLAKEQRDRLAIDRFSDIESIRAALHSTNVLLIRAEKTIASRDELIAELRAIAPEPAGEPKDSGHVHSWRLDWGQTELPVWTCNLCGRQEPAGVVAPTAGEGYEPEGAKARDEIAAAISASTPQRYAPAQSAPLTLRQRFALAALQSGLLSGFTRGDYASIGWHACALADAVLAAERGEGKP
jgi:hypothetical protein